MGARHFSGGQGPQKVIGFDHFVHENANFFLISQKTHFFLISQKVGGQDNFLGEGAFAPSLPTSGDTTGYTSCKHGHVMNIVTMFGAFLMYQHIGKV